MDEKLPTTKILGDHDSLIDNELGISSSEQVDEMVAEARPANSFNQSGNLNNKQYIDS